MPARALLDRLLALTTRADLSPEDRAAVAALLLEVGAPAGPPTGAALPTLAPDATFLTLAPGGLTEPEDARGTGLEALAERYEVLGPLGEGGMSTVWRVEDRALHRGMALKLMRPELLRRPESRARFVEEAQLTAQLQHPGILPVHELGELPDGRAWFTMKEVYGRTLRQVLREAHDDEEGLEKHELHRLVSDFHRACEALAYAHAMGVVHRDLKPDNIMMGDFGEVLVLDWGLARVRGRPDRSPGARDTGIRTDRTDSDAFATRLGRVAGTPAYMPPEQAAGGFHTLTPAADVYAMGAVLFEILSGEAAFAGDGPLEVLAAVRRGERRPLPTGGVVPDDLRAICERAMHPDSERRFADGEALATAVGAWLDGERQRERALAFLHTARALAGEVEQLRGDSGRLRIEAEALLEGAPGHQLTDEKRLAWARQDMAERKEQEAGLRELMSVEALRASLAHLSSFSEAHDALADYYRARHAAAEADRDHRAATLFEAQLRMHDRGQSVAYLRGTGRLSLTTDPPGAVATLYRYRCAHRRLEPERVKPLGTTPLTDVPLPMGSYLVTLEAPGREPVRYPVHLRRQERWQAGPVPLPPAGALGPDEVYIPAGWFLSGGDPEAPNSLPAARVWLDGFIARVFPVTNSDFIDFLNDLAATGREAQALAHVPRAQPGRLGEQGAMIYGRDEGGRFHLQVDADGDEWKGDWPVGMVDFAGARAYADWYAARTGLPWRLPYELEWEKAARGVDGRFFPWGDFLDPSFCCIQGSQPGQLLPSSVYGFPGDVSAYGVRGVAGNVRVWCQDPWSRDGPRIRGGRFVPEPESEETNHRALRGASFAGTSRNARCARRTATIASHRTGAVGFRLVRSSP